MPLAILNNKTKINLIKFISRGRAAPVFANAKQIKANRAHARFQIYRGVEQPGSLLGS